jgi:hypothetical protein
VASSISIPVHYRVATAPILLQPDASLSNRLRSISKLTDCVVAYLAGAGFAGYTSGMARERKDLERLAKQLASLTPEERARVFAKARPQVEFQPPPRGYKRPRLSGGGEWTGGSLRREELYGDDGR